MCMYACVWIMNKACVVILIGFNMCFRPCFLKNVVFLHMYISLALRSCLLSSAVLFLFSSTARNVLVLCVVSTYANRPVMWMPKYDVSLQADCQTIALDQFLSVIWVKGIAAQRKSVKDGDRRVREGAFGCLSLSLLNKSLLSFPGKGVEVGKAKKKGGRWVWGV